MAFTRTDAWDKGGDFSNEALHWYAVGVQALKSRPITDPTSWWFLAAVHDVNLDTWQNMHPGDPLFDIDPNDPLINTFWFQCQHRTWYFFPWHRGHLLALEAHIRKAIVDAGGPADWALPYWNYNDTNNPNAGNIPLAFTDIPFEGGPNPLYEELRFGPFPININDIPLQRPLSERQFEGVANGDTGFGGVLSAFSHGGERNHEGRVEQNPHDYVHGAVGGQSGPQDGLMSDLETAALDPIFYLHHCNIDRLWEVWKCRDDHNIDPSKQDWLDGPADGQFIMPFPDGFTWVYQPKDIKDTLTISPINGIDYSYQYDNIADPLSGPSPLALRMDRLNVAPMRGLMMSEEPVSQPKPELVGANKEKIQLGGGATSTNVQMDKPMMNRVTSSFQAFDAGPGAAKLPDRIFLNLENIRSNRDGYMIDVYIGLPEGANPADFPNNHVGVVTLFGVKKASRADQPHGGMGVSVSLEITHVVDELHLQNQLNNISDLEVRLVPRTPISEKDEVTVDRISIYRQPA